MTNVIELIPVNHELEIKMKNMLSKYKMFGTVEQFIDLFNSGIINSNNELVGSIANTIENTYKNITLYKKKLLIKTPEEVSCENIIALLEGWKILIYLKRLSNYIFEENYPSDTKIVFNTKNQGVPLIEFKKVNDDEEFIELQQHWASTKIVSRTEKLAENLLTRVYLKTYNDDPDSCYFLISDLIDLDDSFFTDIEKTIISKSLID